MSQPYLPYPQTPQTAPNDLVGPAQTPPGPVVAWGIAMKRRHPVAAWLLWPILTFGIYHYVWYFKIHDEMARLDRRQSAPAVGPLLVLVLLGWTIIAPMVSYYNCGIRIREAQRKAGLPPTCSPVAGMLLMFVFGLTTVYYQIQLNKICDFGHVREEQPIPLYF